MRTNHPTTELFFVLAFTYCKLRVYKTEEKFARKILIAAEVEMVESTASSDFHEVDTRVLLSLISKALPMMIEEMLPSKTRIEEIFAIKPS